MAHDQRITDKVKAQGYLTAHSYHNWEGDHHWKLDISTSPNNIELIDFTDSDDLYAAVAKSEDHLKTEIVMFLNPSTPGTKAVEEYIDRSTQESLSTFDYEAYYLGGDEDEVEAILKPDIWKEVVENLDKDYKKKMSQQRRNVLAKNPKYASTSFAKKMKSEPRRPTFSWEIPIKVSDRD